MYPRSEQDLSVAGGLHISSILALVRVFVLANVVLNNNDTIPSIRSGVTSM
jgi:hypothetical protein